MYLESYFEAFGNRKNLGESFGNHPNIGYPPFGDPLNIQGSPIWISSECSDLILGTKPLYFYSHLLTLMMCTRSLLTVLKNNPQII